MFRDTSHTECLLGSAFLCGNPNFTPTLISSRFRIFNLSLRTPASNSLQCFIRNLFILFQSSFERTGNEKTFCCTSISCFSALLASTRQMSYSLSLSPTTFMVCDDIYRNFPVFAIAQFSDLLQDSARLLSTSRSLEQSSHSVTSLDPGETRAH